MDQDFIQELNGETTRQFVKCSDELIEDRDSKQRKRANYSFKCSMTTGYPYPADAII